MRTLDEMHRPLKIEMWNTTISSEIYIQRIGEKGIVKWMLHNKVSNGSFNE